jgi:hypothetical protein
MSVSLRRFLVLPVLIVAILIGAAMMANPASAQRGSYTLPGGVFQRIGADLVVTSTSQGYSQYGGYYTDAVVVNQGNTSAGAFYVGNNGSYLPVSGLNVGASTVVRFYRGSYCETGGTVMADAFNQIYELSEGNNSRAWSIIC